jgi:hypothetical protein
MGALTGGAEPTGSGDLGGKFEVTLSKISALEATTEGDVAFAAEYCEIVRTSASEFMWKAPL